MPLKVESRIYVPTYDGAKEIQLCIGSITDLSPKEKVDVILVSALPGDYIPTRRSVIGALKRDLQINVKELAMNKAENYLRTCQCWVSQRLSHDAPYGRLVCWENVSRAPATNLEELSKLMRGLFRALMPVFNTENSSVITPLLGSGIQGISPLTILEAMVTSADAWMRMGLPLKTLKIVIYSSGADPDTAMFKRESGSRQGAMAVFTRLKINIEKRIYIPEDPVPDFDVFMIYEENDQVITDVMKSLKSISSSIKLHSCKDVDCKPSSWQHSMYNAMLKCTRIVPFLTSNYLKSKECIDLYNIALCCNRQTRRNILTPVMLERVADLPGFMNMVQWIDGRTSEKHSKACENLLEQIKEGNDTRKSSYDIFISYSHKLPQLAKNLLAEFQKIDPKLKIFFDYEELKSGVSWQQTLYKAIDASRCVVALVSPSYMKSPVCSEEMNLSVAKFLTDEKPFELIPVCVEPVDLSCYPFLLNANISKAYEKNMDHFMKDFANSVVGWLKSGQKNDYFIKQRESLNLEKIATQSRAEVFHSSYIFQNGRVDFKDTMSKTNERTEAIRTSDENSIQNVNADNVGDIKTKTTCDVLFSYSLRDQGYVKLIKQLLEHLSPRLNIVDSARTDSEQNQWLEAAKVIVVLLSPSYLRSKKELAELDVIINRERGSETSGILYAVQLKMLPTKPTYVRLLPCETCFTDHLWKEVVQNVASDEDRIFGKHVDAISENLAGEWGLFHDEEIVAALKICCDVIQSTDDSSNRIKTYAQERGILLNISQLQKEDQQNEMKQRETDAVNANAELRKDGIIADSTEAREKQKETDEEVNRAKKGFNQKDDELQLQKNDTEAREKQKENDEEANRSSPMRGMHRRSGMCDIL